MATIERWKCVEIGSHRARLAILGANNDHIWGYVTVDHFDVAAMYTVGKEYVVSTREMTHSAPINGDRS